MEKLIVCPSCRKFNRLKSGFKKAAVPVCAECKTELEISAGYQELNFSELTKLIRNSSLPVVVDFWAPWCGPCRSFAPVFSKVAKDLSENFQFVKINTQDYPEAAEQFQIRGIPSLAIFKNGQEKTRQSGALPEPYFRQFLEPWLQNLKTTKGDLNG